jgi:hypothetical protein
MRQRGTAGANQRPEILDGDPSDSQLIFGSQHWHAHRKALLQELNLRRVTSAPKYLNIERQRLARLALSNAWVFSRIGVSGALA